MFDVFERVIDSGEYIDGNETERLEEEFSHFFQTNYAVGVSCGTDALILSLRASNIGEGDEVIVPSLTFPATAMAVAEVGAKPVFAEIDRTLTLDVEDVKNLITSDTKAIIAVHWAGLMADISPLSELCKTHDLILIEDAAQAHGSLYHGCRAGSIGDFGCFSFHATKTLAALGNGGMITTQNIEYLQKIRLLRNFGRNGRESFICIGRNSRLGEFQAGILRLKLKNIENINNHRTAVANRYRDELGDWIYPPAVPNGFTHVYHLYIAQTHHRDFLYQELRKNGIEAVVHYREPCHQQPVFKKYANRKLPVTEKICKQIISLPLTLSYKSQSMVIETIKSIFINKK